jgi:hypothetical protein
MTLKMLLWYSLGSILWFVALGFVPVTTDAMLPIVGGFAMFSLGLLLGLSMRSPFVRRPWLLAFLPLLHFFVGLFL